ncbi:substrate-binding domain-containing protein [Nonomuraea sp. NPDC052129]|uniref:substrate-binding domain-containing protein n=1 Tax=Nonomuraea sp. NPDC052129 TaxID=3154651 RepID=UPI0034355954
MVGGDWPVPQDVAVMAICPDGVAERASPSLTSVLIPAEEVGREAVRLVMDKLDGRAVPESTLLTLQLAIRASTLGPAGLS